VLFPQLCEKHSEQSSRACEPTSFDLIIELKTVCASLLPSLQNVALVRVKQTPFFSSFRVMHLRILFGLSKFAYRRTCQFQFSHDGSLTESLFHESTHIFIVRDTLVSSDLLLKVVVPHPFRPLIGRRRASSVVFLGICYLAAAVVFDALRLCRNRIRSTLFDFRQAVLLAIHHLFEPFPQILQQVESIGHLLSLRCAFLGCRCIISTPISADYLHFGMTT